MPTLFTVSLVLLGALMLLHRYELVSGRRFGAVARRWLDHYSHAGIAGTVTALTHCTEFMRRDVFLRVLHLTSYVALVSVRFVERRLARITEFLHSVGRAGKRSVARSKARNSRRSDS